MQYQEQETVPPGGDIMTPDYYLVLGITADASQTDIKDAYRRLAKEFHPDHYKGNHRPFQAIQEAYAVLSDPDRRRRHDAQGQNRNPVSRRDLFSGPLEPLVPDPAAPPFFRHPGTRNFHPFQPVSTPEQEPFFSGRASGIQSHPGRVTTIVRGDRKYSPQTGGSGKTPVFWDFLQNIF
jgi:curved DNA-binding protein CbpA